MTAMARQTKTFCSEAHALKAWANASEQAYLSAQLTVETRDAALIPARLALKYAAIF
jgi:hypothetical protein